MANIDIFYKGLTGLHNALTIDDGQNFSQLRTAIISDEGLTAGYYGRVSITKNGTFYDSTDDSTTTLATAGLGDNDVVVCATVRPQATKQAQQEMTLDIAQLKKRAGGDTTKPYYRALNTYNVNNLPSKYSGDTVVDNAAALAAGRPWS
jgi:hypothetical protein